MKNPPPELVRNAVRDLMLAGWGASDVSLALKVHLATVYRHRDAIAEEGEKREAERLALAAALESD